MSVLQKRDTVSSLSQIEDNESKKVAAIGYTIVREVFPVRDAETDLALAVRIELLAEIVKEVGTERFMAAVKQAIAQSRSRYDVTVKRIRECAGMDRPQLSPAMKAWQQVTEIVARHVRRSPEGGYRLEPYHQQQEGRYCIFEVPQIPEATRRAVMMIGGWAALAQTDASYWNQRMRDFCAAYYEDASA